MLQKLQKFAQTNHASCIPITSHRRIKLMRHLMSVFLENIPRWPSDAIFRMLQERRLDSLTECRQYTAGICTVCLVNNILALQITIDLCVAGLALVAAHIHRISLTSCGTIKITYRQMFCRISNELQIEWNCLRFHLKKIYFYAHFLSETKRHCRYCNTKRLINSNGLTALPDILLN